MHGIEDLLAAAGQSLAGAPFRLDSGGVCHLGFHGDRRMTIEPEPGTSKVFLYAVVGGLPRVDAESVYSALLVANLFGRGTAESWFAIDPRRDAVLLNRVIDTERLEPDAFGTIVAGFMEMVVHWSDRLADPQVTTVRDAAPGAAARLPSPGMVRA